MNKKGFTLIEMIIVVSIIAIMAGTMFPSLMAYRDRGRMQELEKHEVYLNKAMKQYYALTGRYPLLIAGTDYNDAASPYTLTTPDGETKLKDLLGAITGIIPDIAAYKISYADTGGIIDLTRLALELK